MSWGEASRVRSLPKAVRGTEVQIDYLFEELGGRLRASDQPPAQVKGDGQLAHRLLLPFPPSPPVPLPQPVEATP